MPLDHQRKTVDSKPSGAHPLQDAAELRGNLNPGECTLPAFPDEIESIYRYAPVGLCVLDTELRFKRINERLAEINGIPVEDHIGRTVREIGPHLADQAEQILYRILETGEPLLDVEVSGITVAQPDVIRTWIASLLPLKQSDGTINGINIVAQEITKRKQAQEALRESEALLSAILNELPIGVGVFDYMGNVVLINDLMGEHIPYMMPGRGPERRQRWQTVDSAGMPVPPDQWPCARALRGETVIPGVEFTYTDEAGGARWVIVSAVPFAGLKSGQAFAITVVQDITELKQAERTLYESNQELNEYTYAVVHNVKAPFRAVKNYANFLLEDLADTLGGEPKQFLAGIKKAVDQANRQFSDLDALYLIRKHTVEFEPVDMQVLLDEFVSMFTNASDRQLSPSEQWPVLRTDRLLLRQSLMALIENGFKYNQSAVKQVEIGWQKATDRFEISVRDNGIGIDPQYHEHIFHIFKRLHTEDEYEGTGIGLALAKKALQKLGGSLRLESAVGEGSTFIVSLPAAMIEGKLES